ncbi:hypothetical protein FF1_014853 [Malus domestica]
MGPVGLKTQGKISNHERVARKGDPQRRRRGADRCYEGGECEDSSDWGSMGSTLVNGSRMTWKSMAGGRSWG